MRNLFNANDVKETIDRIQMLSPETKALWGKMSVDQMLAHCCVAYDMTFTNQYKKPSGLKKILIKWFAKNAVVGPKPYPKNGRTAPEFVISNARNFEAEKKKLIDYIQQVQALGSEHFEQKESHSFGPLSSKEWNVLFSKHLDHHLTQFGV